MKEFIFPLKLHRAQRSNTYRSPLLFPKCFLIHLHAVTLYYRRCLRVAAIYRDSMVMWSLPYFYIISNFSLPSFRIHMLHHFWGFSIYTGQIRHLVLILFFNSVILGLFCDYILYVYFFVWFSFVFLFFK